MTKLTTTAAVLFGLLVGASASAAPVVPDALFLESNANRANGSATGDIATSNLGDISGGQLRTTGIAGRIHNFADVYEFTSRSLFSLEFSDLAFPNLPLFGLNAGMDIDGCEGFDDTDCSTGTQLNGTKTAIFSLDDGMGNVLSTSFTSPEAAGTSIFANIMPGTYTFMIDGGVPNLATEGSAYDVLITAQPVPLPAGLPLAAAALGALGLVRARRKA